MVQEILKSVASTLVEVSVTVSLPILLDGATVMVGVSAVITTAVLDTLVVPAYVMRSPQLVALTVSVSTRVGLLLTS
jgi:hypothetical protein